MTRAMLFISTSFIDIKFNRQEDFMRAARWILYDVPEPYQFGGNESFYEGFAIGRPHIPGHECWCHDWADVVG